MAAAFMQSLSGGAVTVRSAGSAPADSLNPVVIEAMREVGIDLVEIGASPRRLDPDSVRISDVVITMGCGDTCPVFPGKRYEDWQVADPAGQDLETVRRVRDDIRARVTALLSEIVPS